MTRIRTTLEHIFRSQLGFIPEENTHRRQIPSWDSLKHIQLLLLIQKEFQVSFSIEEIDQLDSFAGIDQLLHKKKVSLKD